uniref:Uncharacterized protein n=1 Tax=Anguilla anguilla TaxID=7936 RepID=A0A0E9VWA8_ANGAN
MCPRTVDALRLLFIVAVVVHAICRVVTR